MSLWLILAAMTLLALGLALAPFLRRAGAASTRREHNLSVYRAQLAELEQERERGLLGEREAEAAELEIKRRMLAADAEDRGGGGAASRPVHLAAAVALVIGLPVLSAAIYSQLGKPGQPSAPFAERADERRQVAEQPGTTRGQASGGGQSVPSVATMIGRLEERLEENPDDLEAWFRLGRAFQLAEQPERAAEAYREALALRDDVPELHAAFAEASIMAADGVVTEAARAAIARALELDPANTRARFYQGLAFVQRGERERALDTWVELVRDAPAEAPWLPALEQRVAALAEDLGRDPDQVSPPSAAALAERTDPPEDEAGAPPPDQMPGAADTTPEERAQRIRGMVEGLAARLEEEPDDVEGWRMLARSYRVLGEPEKAVEAAARVAELLPDDSAAQVDYAEALLMLEDDDAPLSEEIVAQLRRVLELDEDNPQALFFLGRAAVERGRHERAETYWRRLLAQIPEDAPQRRQLEGLIERLRPGG